MPSKPKVGAVCGKATGTDLCGGARGATCGSGLKAAKTLGVTTPLAVLASADEVIE